MLRVVVVLALLAHGIGHAVGFWMPVPQWLAVSWLVPGVVFVASAWGAWTRATWWPRTAAVGSGLSIAALLPQPSLVAAGGPFMSAFAFDMIVLAALVVPWSRRTLLAI